MCRAAARRTGSAQPMASRMGCPRAEIASPTFGTELAELDERQLGCREQPFEGGLETQCDRRCRRDARDMASGLDPRVLVGSELLGAQGGDVPERVGEVVLIAIGGEQRLLVGAGVSHSPALMRSQRGSRRKPLAFDQGLGDHAGPPGRIRSGLARISRTIEAIWQTRACRGETAPAESAAVPSP